MSRVRQRERKRAGRQRFFCFFVTVHVLTEVSGSESSSSSFLASTTAWYKRRFLPSDATKQALALLQ